jgi:predicted ester cyclase
VSKAASVILNAYPDLQFVIDDEISEGDKVVSRWTMTGTHPGELDGDLAAGVQVIQFGVTIFRLSNARVDEFWLLSDNPEFTQLLGVVPPDEA